VIYLLDGGMDEDFIHVSGIVQFDTFPWISLIPDSILVGIVNVDRKRDFTFPTTLAADKKLIPTSGGSAKFIEFINKELFPFVEDRYRGSKDRTLIGQSLGGLLAAEVLIKQPELFTRYVIISPSVWWDNGSLLNASTEILKTRQSKAEVYIGVGKEGLTSIDPPRVMEVDANVLADKLRRAGDANLNVKFDYLPAEDHATIGHQAVFNAFRLLYPAKRKD
jgi:predicted alpha/beta superfamily hydrolase